MATTKEVSNNNDKVLQLKPLTRDNILFYYAPLNSMACYAALSVNVMNPSLALRYFPKRDVLNFLLIHTMFGTTLYLYSRPHLKALPTKKRVLYSLLGSSLFSMGSVLIWAVVRSAAPKNNGLLTAIGCASGLAMAKIGYDYVEHIDSLAVAHN